MALSFSKGLAEHAEEILADSKSYYHGTYHDIKTGSFLRPGKKPTNFGGKEPPGIRSSSVYVTDDEATAWRYARMVTPVETGAVARVYKVSPIGELSPDETMDNAYLVPKAKVVGRLDQPSSPTVARTAFAPRNRLAEPGFGRPASSADKGLRRKDQQESILQTRRLYGFK